MTKTKTLKAITIDGTVLKRRTARNYSHMIARFNKNIKTWHTVSWIGRPDLITCLLYTSPSPRDGLLSRMPSSA